MCWAGFRLLTDRVVYLPLASVLPKNWPQGLPLSSHTYALLLNSPTVLMKTLGAIRFHQTSHCGRHNLIAKLHINANLSLQISFYSNIMHSFDKWCIRAFLPYLNGRECTLFLWQVYHQGVEFIAIIIVVSRVLCFSRGRFDKIVCTSHCRCFSKDKSTQRVINTILMVGKGSS